MIMNKQNQNKEKKKKKKKKKTEKKTTHDTDPIFYKSTLVLLTHICLAPHEKDIGE